MLATCGAAAEVPKKFGKLPLFIHSVTVLGSSPADSVKPRKVLLPPSGPTRSGFCRVTGVVRRVPVASKRIGSPPAEEKSSSAGVKPQDGALTKNAAPTANAPAA